MLRMDTVLTDKGEPAHTYSILLVPRLRWCWYYVDKAVDTACPKGMESLKGEASWCSFGLIMTKCGTPDADE